jgi:Tfp pilus assembly protein PilN
MRAVNLIPPEERRVRAARTGPLPYLIVVALVAVLGAVTVLVVTNNRISDRKAKVAQLEQERDVAQANMEALRPFAEFASMKELRTATVTSLAQSRFDWERVMRELALVLPDDTWLVQLEATVSPEVQLAEGVGLSLRDSVPGPALELVGCTVSQEAVGRLVSALRDIDGVTRVAVLRSERPEQSTSQASAGASGGAVEGDCRTRDFITRFEIVAAFDEVPAPAVAMPPPLPDGSEASGEQTETPEQDSAQESAQQGIQEGQETAAFAGGA